MSQLSQRLANDLNQSAANVHRRMDYSNNSAMPAAVLAVAYAIAFAAQTIADALRKD